VRVIAASYRDLKKEVDEGRFRRDLFYRLSVFPIEGPPLRERPKDIGPLVAHSIRQSTHRMNRPEPQVTKAALDQLAEYDWPGNVRELQNTIERAIILWSEGPLTFNLSCARVSTSRREAMLITKGALPTRDELKRQEREAITNAWKQTNGKVSGPGGAAELLGMKPTTLTSRISALRVERKLTESLYPRQRSDTDFIWTDTRHHRRIPAIVCLCDYESGLFRFCLILLVAI
jgi:transcriptional regulator with GAF, ATPase, and Fis domain